MQQIAVYLRVSTRKQDTKSQEPDLNKWVDAFADGKPVRWYRDKATGRTMDRPGWKRLEADIDAGNVSAVVVWRLDRLGRTASGLTALFEKLAARKVNLVSLKDGVDLSTAAGRLIANVLASCRLRERSPGRADRRRSICRQTGRQNVGRVPQRPSHRRHRRTGGINLPSRAEGSRIAAIARSTGLSRPTVYSVLRDTV